MYRLKVNANGTTFYTEQLFNTPLALIRASNEPYILKDLSGTNSITFQVEKETEQQEKERLAKIEKNKEIRKDVIEWVLNYLDQHFPYEK